jgi:hypothetical protein
MYANATKHIIDPTKPLPGVSGTPLETPANDPTNYSSLFNPEPAATIAARPAATSASQFPSQPLRTGGKWKSTSKSPFSQLPSSMPNPYGNEPTREVAGPDQMFPAANRNTEAANRGTQAAMRGEKMPAITKKPLNAESAKRFQSIARGGAI